MKHAHSAPGRQLPSAAHRPYCLHDGPMREWLLMQMLADFLTTHELIGNPYDTRTYACEARPSLQHGRVTPRRSRSVRRLT